MENSPPAGAGTHKTPTRGLRSAIWISGGFALFALALAWQWYETRNQANAIREEIARRVRDSETDSRDARLSARQAQESSREALAKLAQLDLKISDMQRQQAALDALYQDLSGTRDEWTLREIEQTLTIASQQLQLTGNVAAALTALKMADARLARTARPRLLPLRKVFARDMEHLKAGGGPDISELTSKLDQLVASVGSIPLAQDQRPQAQPSAPTAPTGRWARFLSELRAVMNRFVTVQRIEGDEPPLLTPTQSFFLRENLKLRLLSARSSLIAHDIRGYRNDLKVSSSWLERNFYTGTGTGAVASALLKELLAGASNMSLPTIDESLAAVRDLETPRQRVGQ
jgi:uroporphyrin-3 C-methyltransferase